MAILAVGLTGCVSVSHLTDTENVWISEKSLQNDRVFYCMANKAPDGKRASPVCVEPTYIERGQTISRPGSKLDD